MQDITHRETNIFAHIYSVVLNEAGGAMTAMIEDCPKTPYRILPLVQALVTLNDVAGIPMQPHQIHSSYQERQQPFQATEGHHAYWSQHCIHMHMGTVYEGLVLNDWLHRWMALTFS